MTRTQAESRKQGTGLETPETTGIRGGARSYLDQLLRGNRGLQGPRTTDMSVRFQALDQTQTTHRRPTPTPRGQRIATEELADMTADLAVATFMSNVSKVERVVVEAWDVLDQHYGDRNAAVVTIVSRLQHLKLFGGSSYDKLEALAQAVQQATTSLRHVGAEASWPRTSHSSAA